MLDCQPRTSDITGITQTCTNIYVHIHAQLCVFWGLFLALLTLSNDHKNRFYCMCHNSRENSYHNSFFLAFLYVNVAGSWLFFTAVPLNCHTYETATGMLPTDKPAAVVKLSFSPSFPQFQLVFHQQISAYFIFLVPSCIYDSITFITKSGCKKCRHRN